MLRSAGVDLSRPRDIVHYLYFPNQEKAEQAGEKVRTLGLSVAVGPAATGSQWLVRADHDLIVNAETVAPERSALERICVSLGGDYDGWEASAPDWQPPSVG